MPGEASVGPQGGGGTPTLPSEEQLVDALQARMGADAQRRLAEASVAIAGLGGLGSNIAIALARTGVGRLHLIDFDVVDLTNLNRQQYGIADLGRPKTEALREAIVRINPYLDVVTDRVRLDAALAVDLLGGYPIVVEAFDKPDAKAMLVDALCPLPGGPNVVGASGMAGLAPANLIATRRITDRWYLCGDGRSDVGSGLPLLASRVAICAGHQATAVVQLILGKDIT